MARAPSKPRRLRAPLYALPVIALVAVALWGWLPRPVPVEMARVDSGPLMSGFTEEARTDLRSPYRLAAPVDGMVERIAVEPGQQVREGEMVAVVRPSSSPLLDPASRAQDAAQLAAVTSEIEAARFAAAAAEASQVRSALALQRGLLLAHDRLISDDSLDELEAQAVSDAAALLSARKRVQTLERIEDGYRRALGLQGAGSRAQGVRLRAPVAGRVIRRHVESAVPVARGQPLLDFGQTLDLEVVADVLTTDAVRLRPGMRVRLSDWGGAQPLAGQVRSVEPGGFAKVSALGVEERRTRVRIALDDASRQVAWSGALGDGFQLQAEFIVWQHPSVSRVPLAALFRDGDAWAVYAVQQGRARLRHVRIGHTGQEYAQVLSGLDEGVQVVLYPGSGLRQDMRVAPRGR